MDDDSLNLIFGIIFLILIVHTMFLWSVIPTNNLQYASKINDVENPYVVPQKITAAPQRSSVDLPNVVPTPNQIVQPPINNRAVAPKDPPINVIKSDSSSSAKTLASFITIEQPELPDIVYRPTLQPQIPRQDFSDFVTVYSLVHQNVSQVLPTVSMKLVNPPLVIDYTITPLRIVDIKYIEYKKGLTMHQEIIPINRTYENSWFQVIVRDKDTGEIIDEEGFGRSYSQDNKKQLMVQECGNISVEFSGEHAVVDLTMRVKNDGIAP